MEGNLPAFIAGAKGIGDGEADKDVITVCKWPKNIADLLEYLECWGKDLSLDWLFDIRTDVEDDCVGRFCCWSTFKRFCGRSFVGDNDFEFDEDTMGDRSIIIKLIKNWL